MTISTLAPTAAASLPDACAARNEAERKLPSSQNLSGRLERSAALRIMIRRKRSYRAPLASEKQCTYSSSSSEAASAEPPAERTWPCHRGCRGARGLRAASALPSSTRMLTSVPVCVRTGTVSAVPPSASRVVHAADEPSTDADADAPCDAAMVPASSAVRRSCHSPGVGTASRK